MSIPRHPTEAAGAQPPTTVLPAVPYDLGKVVRDFEAAAESLGTTVPSAEELSHLCRQVAALTTELFPGTIAVEPRVDPEILGDLYLLFKVRTTGSMDDVASREERWHRGLLSVARAWPGLFRLSIDAR